jgi:hypothetical protein
MRAGLPSAVVAALLLVLSGCEDEARTTAPPASRNAFSPEQFGDIPLPRGYVFSPGQDQLAVTLAGGAVRRFEVTMEQRENAEPQATAQLLSEMDRDLSNTGWKQPDGRNDRLEWHKGQERLVLETGRTAGRTTIRLRLRPASLVGP